MSPIVVVTGLTPTLSDFIARLRLDLFDAGQRAGDQPRWTDMDLARALDRATDVYTSAAPLLKQTLIPTWPFSRLYALPPDAWFADAVEYPYGLFPHWSQPFEERLSALVPPPASAPPATISLGAGGALSSGAYSWQITHLVPGGGETMPTPLASGTATAGQRALLGGLPLGPYGVVDRRIYRTAAGGTQPTLAGSVGDNLTTIFVDGAADAAIAAAAAPPIANTTQGIPLFELQISDSKLPNAGDAGGQDPNYGWIGLRYAAKHELDANGTTMPERHWDVLCLGAAMFAIWAYLVPTADNFHYVDGQFRDQVDDTKVPAAWAATGRDLETRFNERIALVKNEENSGVAAVGSWGDKPERWDRL